MYGTCTVHTKPAGKSAETKTYTYTNENIHVGLCKAQHRIVRTCMIVSLARPLGVLRPSFLRSQYEASSSEEALSCYCKLCHMHTVHLLR